MEAELEVAIKMADAVFGKMSGEVTHEAAATEIMGGRDSWMAKLWQSIDRLNAAKSFNVTLGEIADIEDEVSWYGSLARGRALTKAFDLLSEERLAGEHPTQQETSTCQPTKLNITEADLRRDAARLNDLQAASGCNDY